MIKLLQIIEEHINVHKFEKYVVVDIINEQKEKIGSFTLEHIEGNLYVDTDASIDQAFRGKGYYKKALIEFLRLNPKIVVSSLYRSDDAEHAWKSLISKLPSDFKYEIIEHPEEETQEILLSMK